MNLILLYFASLAFVNEIIFFSAASIITVDEDAFRNVSELITSKGYPVENHIAQTSDGYLLSLQRIPHGIKGPSSLKKPVVFCMHGLLADAGSFVWNPPNQSYAASIITVDEDAFRNVSELITSKGYPVENHIAQTSDGYLLSLQRIPHGIKGPSSLKKPVVFCMHGLLADAGSFVWNPPNQSYGFILADNDYDVWIGNSRGNSYSRNHVRLSPNSEEFWDFSLDEMIAYDMPAMIDYILNKTGEKQLSFIGHSQGNTIAFALLSQSQLYNKKIKLFIALAPVIKLGYIQGPLKLLSSIGRINQPFYKTLGLVEFLPDSKVFDIIKVIVCGTPARFICVDTQFLFLGVSTHMNHTRLPTYFNNFPSGTSTKSLIHFSQMVASNKFQKYNYFLPNMEHYNQDTPPVYDVSKITTPIALMSSPNDLIATPEEVNAIRPLLKSTVADYVVPSADFTHGDFVYAFDAYPLVIKKVLSLLQQHNNN